MSKVKRRELEIVPSNTASRNDKRVFCRFVVEDIPVRFKDLKVGERGNAICRDIGGGGAGIECNQELRVKTPLELWFDLADGFDPMHLLGKVSWLRSVGTNWRVGVAFDRPRMMSLSRILQSGEPQSE